MDFSMAYAFISVIKNIRQLTTIRGVAPIFKNKMAWAAIKPEKIKENAFRVLES